MANKSLFVIKLCVVLYSLIGIPALALLSPAGSKVDSSFGKVRTGSHTEHYSGNIFPHEEKNRNLRGEKKSSHKRMILKNGFGATDALFGRLLTWSWRSQPEKRNPKSNSAPAPEHSLPDAVGDAAAVHLNAAGGDAAVTAVAVQESLQPKARAKGGRRGKRKPKSAPAPEHSPPDAIVG